MQPGLLAKAAPEVTHDECLERTLIECFGTNTYANYFRNRVRFFLEPQELTAVARHPFVFDLLATRHRSALEDAARRAFGPGVSVRVVLDPHTPQDPVARAAVPSALSVIEKPSLMARAQIPSPPAQQPHPPRAQRRLARFDQFVEGPGSRAGLAAALEFAESSAGQRVPLYLFGGTGTGKTHLLEAIAQALGRGPAAPGILLITAEQFTNQFTGALRGHTLPSFRLKFRGIDILLVDDVDFLDGKPKVQEEFLHTLQQLESTGRSVVVTADRHPRLLSRMLPELQTRFLAGLTCRLETADLATREQIVVRKALMLGLLLPPEAARIIAQKVRAGIRELEGALQNLRLLHRVSGQPVTVAMAKQVVSEIERDCVRVIRLPDIERLICEMFGVTADDLRSSRRTRTLAEPRMLAMYLARRHTRAAYAEIGNYFGGRNHATVISAEKKIRSAIDAGSELMVSVQPWRMADLVQALEQQLLAS